MCACKTETEDSAQAKTVMEGYYQDKSVVVFEYKETTVLATQEGFEDCTFSKSCAFYQLPSIEHIFQRSVFCRRCCSD